MFTQIFDTQSHYTDSAFDADRHEVLSALPEAGIVHAVLAGTTLEDSTAGIALADSYDYIYAAVGIHPETAGQQPTDYLAQLERLAKSPKVVAIGEIGLDYHYEGYDRGSQSVLLREQLDLAKQLDLPDDNKEAVYERMISERDNIAATYKAEGNSEAKVIRNRQL